MKIRPSSETWHSWRCESVARSYLSKVRRDSVGADFQSVRKLTNYVCAKPPESRLRHFHNTYKQSGDIPRCGGCGY